MITLGSGSAEVMSLWMLRRIRLPTTLFGYSSSAWREGSSDERRTHQLFDESRVLVRLREPEESSEGTTFIADEEPHFLKPDLSHRWKSKPSRLSHAPWFIHLQRLLRSSHVPRLQRPGFEFAVSSENAAEPCTFLTERVAKRVLVLYYLHLDFGLVHRG